MSNPTIQFLVARLAKYESAAKTLAEMLESNTPEPNCSCHSVPPCCDCTMHSGSREALTEFKELDHVLTTESGLLFEDGKQCSVWLADRLAQRHGFQYAEQLVRALEGLKSNL